MGEPELAKSTPSASARAGDASRRRPGSPAAGASSRGVTLVELLIVMVIVGIVMGLGLGVFASLDVEERQAVGLVKNVVRTAQNTAVSRGMPTLVRLDHKAGSVSAEALRVIGTWQFEDPDLRGAFGIGGVLRGAELIDDGYLGAALSFPEEVPGARAEFEVQKDPSFDLADGFSITLVVRREHDGAASLVDLGGACGIQFLVNGALQGWMAPTIDDGGYERKGPHVVCESGGPVVEVGVWVRLELVYDRRELALFVNGAPIAFVEEDARVWDVESRLMLGDERRRWRGALDALVVAAVDSGDAVELPVEMELTSDSPTAVRFDASGHLDRRHHQAPVRIGLTKEGAPAASVLVGLYGTVADGGDG